MKNGISDWLIVAQEDMDVVNDLLKYDHIHTADIVFHCQQAIEKYFKAFLLENGWQLKKMHNLETLYNEIKKIKDLSLDIDIIADLYDRYSKIRYPDDYMTPTEEEAREFYKFALEVEEKIRKELGA